VASLELQHRKGNHDVVGEPLDASSLAPGSNCTLCWIMGLSRGRRSGGGLGEAYDVGKHAIRGGNSDEGSMGVGAEDMMPR